jgi:hypothetical protein
MSPEMRGKRNSLKKLSDEAIASSIGNVRVFKNKTHMLLIINICF